MKKNVFILVCLLATTLLTSCIYKSSTTGGDCTCVSKTIKFPVASQDWQYDNNARRFFCHFNCPEITSAVYTNGQWTVSREYESGTKSAYQVALPESIFKVEELASGNIYYTQHIDYAVGIGWVEITLTNSDYGYEQDGQGHLYNPESMVFIMQLNY